MSFDIVILLLFCGWTAFGAFLHEVSNRAHKKWYDENCDCTCKKCACHRPLEECE